MQGPGTWSTSALHSGLLGPSIELLGDSLFGGLLVSMDLQALANYRFRCSEQSHLGLHAARTRTDHAILGNGMSRWLMPICKNNGFKNYII